MKKEEKNMKNISSFMDSFFGKISQTFDGHNFYWALHFHTSVSDLDQILRSEWW